MQDDTKTILMSLTDSLNRVAENIALLSRTLLKEDVLTPPAFVVAAQEVLDDANATMDKAVKQNEEATLETTEENSDESLEVGSQVKYVGDRESLKGQLGRIWSAELDRVADSLKGCQQELTSQQKTLAKHLERE